MNEAKEVSITFRVNEKDKAQLQAIAKRKGMCLSQLVREAVKEYAEGAAQ